MNLSLVRKQVVGSVSEMLPLLDVAIARNCIRLTIGGQISTSL